MSAITNAVFSQESIEIKWLDKYEWKELSNQKTDNIHLIEVIPVDENEDNWSILGQIMSIEGVLDFSLEEIKDIMFEQIKASTPDAILTFIEKEEGTEYPWILFKIENQKNENYNNYESQLWYIRQGKASLFVNFIAIKEQSLKDDFVREWIEVFKLSVVVEIKE